MNEEVNSGNCTIKYPHQTTLATPKDLWVHAGMKCDLKGIKHGLHCVCLFAQDSKYQLHLTRKP